MLRILEPELMEDFEQSIAYARADFSNSNQWFVDQLLKYYPAAFGHVLDIGCGPCDVMLRLTHSCPEARVTAVDGSAAMIGLAVKAIRSAGQEARITAIQGYIPGLPLTERSFDAVLSKDLLHHLPDPMVLWSEVQRLGKRGATVFVMDLVRPATSQDAREIVETVAPNEPEILKTDFYNSLCAAFTMQEIEAQVRESGLALEILKVSERHMLIKGQLP